MPAPTPDDLYWNPMDLDSDESIPYPKQYIDPWDLENYAYIRQHLDSVDLSSDPSSLGEPQETSGFYYIPAKSIEMQIEMANHHGNTTIGSSSSSNENGRMEKMYDHNYNQNQDAEYYYAMQRAPKYETLARSERQTSMGNYAAIDELLIRNEIANTRRKQCQSVSYHDGSSIYRGHGGSLPLPMQLQDSRYGNRRTEPEREHQRESLEVYDHYDYEPTGTGTEMDLYGIPENSTMQIYEKNKTLRRYQTKTNKNDGPVAKMAKLRSHSFSVGDYEYDPYRLHQPVHQPNYNEDLNPRSEIYDSTGSSPIYDDIRTSHAFQRLKPKHFKLSNYGHLKIDYSFSWNNLNKYIYN